MFKKIILHGLVIVILFGILFALPVVKNSLLSSVQLNTILVVSVILAGLVEYAISSIDLLLKNMQGIRIAWFIRASIYLVIAWGHVIFLTAKNFNFLQDDKRITQTIVISLIASVIGLCSFRFFFNILKKQPK